MELLILISALPRAWACFITAGALDFDLSSLNASLIIRVPPHWTYAVSPCGTLPPKVFGCATAAPAFQMDKNGDCKSLGTRDGAVLLRAWTRGGRGGLSVAFPPEPDAGPGCARTSTLDVECAPVAPSPWDPVDLLVARDAPFSVFEPRPCAYAFRLRSPAGCPLQCARGAAGAVCSGEARGACVIAPGGNSATCVCKPGFSGASCSLATPQQLLGSPSASPQRPAFWAALLLLALLGLARRSGIGAFFRICAAALCSSYRRVPAPRQLLPLPLLALPFALIALFAFGPARVVVSLQQHAAAGFLVPASAAEPPSFAKWRAFRACLDLSPSPCGPWPDLPHTPPPLAELELHAREVFNATADLRSLPMHSYAGYEGPWLENLFIARAAELADFSSRWYPLVPILAQWTDACCGAPQPLAREHLRRLFNSASTPLRRDVMYVTLVQHDAGTPDVGSFKDCLPYRNVLVLSAGGWGSAPVPLLKGRIAPAAPSARYPHVEDWLRRPRRHVLSFIGRTVTSPTRKEMVDSLRASTLPPEFVHIGENWADWTAPAADTVFALAPRGFGRTSFRLAELIQLGVLPFYVYDDRPWLPYAAARPPQWGAEGLGWVARAADLSEWACSACVLFEPLTAAALPPHTHSAHDDVCLCTLERWRAALQPTADGVFFVHVESAVAAMERRVLAAAREFFTLEAALAHIDDFVLRGPGNSSIQCVAKDVGGSIGDPGEQ